MAFLEQHPLHVRKKIALVITIGVAVILVGSMIAVYVLRTLPADGYESQSSFVRFYATILENAQSFFSGNHDIIPK